MRRLCLLSCLLAIPLVSNAKTAWVLLGDSPHAEVYINAADVYRPPNYVKAWTMLSFKTRQRGGWLSEKRLFMFSCKDQTLEWQQSMYYAEPMGGGEFLHARTLTKYGVGDLRLVELDPSTKDKRIYKDAVPESNFIASFKSLC
jgi:hypothetical protein